MAEYLEKVDTSVIFGIKFFQMFPSVPTGTPDDPTAWVSKDYVSQRISDFNAGDITPDDPLQAFAHLSPVKYSETDLSAEDTEGYRIISIGDTSSPREVIISSQNLISNVILSVKDVSGSAAANNITVKAETGTIDGESEVYIKDNYGCVEMFSDGTDLFNLNSDILITPYDVPDNPSPSPSPSP